MRVVRCGLNLGATKYPPHHRVALASPTRLLAALRQRGRQLQRRHLQQVAIGQVGANAGAGDFGHSEAREADFRGCT